MTTSAAIGYGSSFSIYNGSAYVAVAEVNSFNLNYSRDAIDVTNMDSPNGFRERISGMKDFSATIEVNFKPSVTDVFLAAMDAGRGQFRVTHPDGHTLTFYATVTTYSIQGPVDDKMSASIEFQGAGDKPIWAAA